LFRRRNIFLEYLFTALVLKHILQPLSASTARVCFMKCETVLGVDCDALSQLTHNALSMTVTLLNITCLPKPASQHLDHNLLFSLNFYRDNDNQEELNS
jgi:hypothetical protein